MIMLRKAKELNDSWRRDPDVWFTFFRQDRPDPLADGLGALATLDEDWLPPGASVPPHFAPDSENIIYVLEGALAQKDSMSCCTVVIHAGEFQRMTSGRDSRHSERNASRTDWAHVFRISLLPIAAGLRSSHRLRRVSAADRRGVLCVIASQDGRKGSLLIRQDASIYSAMFDPGQHLIHELAPGHRAWLHVVRGEATLGDDLLVAGDGAGITAEPAISFTARTEGEVLLFDLCEPVPMPPRAESVPDYAASPEHGDTGGLDAFESSTSTPH